MEIDISAEQINNWINGIPIQQAMPHLTPDEREFLMTGITTEEREKMFDE
jgi:hypothetical protein